MWLADVKLNIYQKLAKIRKNVEVLAKNASGYGYKYTSEDLILEKVTGMMDKYGVSLIPGIVPGTTKVEPYHYVETKTKKDGDTYEKHTNEIIVSSEIMYRWVNDENPEEFVEVPWVIVGQQADASQAFGSGLSYGNRYMLLKFFQVATTEDDPDNWRSRQREAAKSEEREIAKEIVANIHNHVTAFLEKHADQRDALIAAIKEVAKDENGKATDNYMKIKDPVVASQTLKRLNKDFFKDPEISEDKE